MKRSVAEAPIKEKRDAKEDGAEQTAPDDETSFREREDFEVDENVDKKDNIGDRAVENKFDENKEFDSQEGSEEGPEEEEEQDYDDSVEAANKRQYILEHTDLKNLPFMPSIISGYQDNRFSPLMGLGGFGNDLLKPFPIPANFGSGLPYGVAYAIPIPVIVSQDDSVLKGELRSKIRNKHNRRTVLTPPFLISSSCNNPCQSSFRCGANPINIFPCSSNKLTDHNNIGCTNNINNCDALNRISNGYLVNTISANGANGNYGPCNAHFDDTDNFQNLPPRFPVQIKPSADQLFTNDCTNENGNINCGSPINVANDGNTKNINIHHIHHVNHHHHHHIHQQGTPLSNPQRVGLNGYTTSGGNFLNDDITNDCMGGPTNAANGFNCNNPCTNVVMVPSGCGVKTI